MMNFEPIVTEKSYLEIISWQKEMLEKYSQVVKDLQTRIDDLEDVSAKYYRIATEAIEALGSYGADLDKLMDKIK